MPVADEGAVLGVMRAVDNAAVVGVQDVAGCALGADVGVGGKLWVGRVLAGGAGWISYWCIAGPSRGPRREVALVTLPSRVFVLATTANIAGSALLDAVGAFEKSAGVAGADFRLLDVVVLPHTGGRLEEAVEPVDREFIRSGALEGRCCADPVCAVDQPIEPAAL